MYVCIWDPEYSAYLQWPWQDKYFTFTLSRPLRAFFFFAVSVSDFNFPLPARPKLSPLMRCKSVPKTLTAKSNTGRMERGIRIRIYIWPNSGGDPTESPSKGCTKLKLN